MTTITLTSGSTTVELHEDLHWADEFDWHPVEQSTTRSITGALIISTATRTGGQPITLKPYSRDSAWTKRDVLQQLKSWAADAGLVLTLVLRSVTYSVVMRHQDGSPIEADPLIYYSDPDGNTNYLVTIKLMTV